MKKYWQIIAAVLIFASLILPASVSAQNLQDFKFESFDADYYLDKDSENASVLKVNETLVAVFPDYDQNHGIARAIPQTYENHKLRLEGLTVTDENGNSLAHTTENQNDNLVVKIQDPGVFVHGRKTYKINYTVHDVIRFFSEHDEFYWDINGDQWAQPFAQVHARIHVPISIESALARKKICYAGTYGSLNQNCVIDTTTTSNEVVSIFSSTDLKPRQTLSIVMGFKPGTFAKSQSLKNAELRQKIETIIAYTFLVLIPLYAGIFMYRRWRKFGDDPKGRGVIIPEYEPPKGLDPLTSDFLIHQKFRNVALSALIIDLAVKKHLVIYEIPKKGLFGKKDYELELTSIPAEASDQVKDALMILFGDSLALNHRVKLSDFRKNTSTRQHIYTLMKGLEDSLASSMHARGYFIKNPKKVKTGYIVWGTVFLFGGGLSLNFGAFLSTVLLGMCIGLIVAGIIVLIFAHIMPARTQEGVLAHDSLLGLKDYIKLAEADRLKFLQSPEGAEKIADKDEFDPKDPKSKIKLFEELLPYAILFGLEKEWAKQFNDLYTTPPDWYQGGNWSSFNAGYLAGSLSSFSSATGTSFASPSSSSSSGFSGGGAGGGGGGGGGGGI